MLIENEFNVAAPVDFLWSYLLDVEKIAPCMPGAELTEVVDDKNWKGKLNAKFGPVSMSFAGTVTIESRDDAAHRVVLSAKGMEQKGKGAANAKVTSWLEPGPSDGVTTVKMEADITLTGAAAQLSRGLLPEISKKLTQNVRRLPAGVDGRGADHARRRCGGRSATAGSAAARRGQARRWSPSRSAGSGSGIAAIWSIIANFFRKLFGLKPKS